MDAIEVGHPAEIDRRRRRHDQAEIPVMIATAARCPHCLAQLGKEGQILDGCSGSAPGNAL